MKPTVRLVRGGVGLLLFAAFASLAVWAQEQELSHVRIVRLSFTEGTVTLQRADVEEWAEAPVNTPIQEGFKISTAENSFAEVEFENSSTARVGQFSQLEFTQLALLPSGGKVNRLTLQQGYATFNVIPEGDDFYEIAVSDATLRPQGKSRFRVDFEQGILQVKVFKGSVEIASREGNGTLGKNTLLEVRPGEEQSFQISQGLTKDAWDEWVEERENRVAMVRNQGPPVPYSNNVSDLLYGFMDLASYGDWVSLPGYGYGWTPYANMGWSPFTAGRWCWYPSFGYTWISAEPWGWLPYHYGSWIYEPGLGWAWIPNSFTGWSPAVVSWYRGPGWVGWAPMSPRLGGNTGGGAGPGLNHCPQPRGCVTAVNEDTLRHGRPVLPNRRDEIDSRGGRIVERPEIQPERLARLPGEPRAYGAGYRSGQLENRDGAAGRMIPTRPSVDSGGGTAPARSPIVFDPEQRRYVNDTSHRSVPAPTGDIGGGGTPASITHTGRPGPVTNYPMPVATREDRGRPGFDNRNEAGAGGPGWVELEGLGGRRAPSEDARAGGSRSGDRNSSAGSSGRPAPVTIDRSDGGSRSTADRGSSSSGSRSGGDRGGSSGRADSGSDRSSGGHSGGSSSQSSGGSSHSSGGSSGGGGGSHSSGGSSGGGGGGSSHSSGGGSNSSSSPKH